MRTGLGYLEQQRNITIIIIFKNNIDKIMLVGSIKKNEKRVVQVYL